MRLQPLVERVVSQALVDVSEHRFVIAIRLGVEQLLRRSQPDLLQSVRFAFERTAELDVLQRTDRATGRARAQRRCRLRGPVAAGVADALVDEVGDPSVSRSTPAADSR